MAKRKRYANLTPEQREKIRERKRRERAKLKPTYGMIGHYVNLRAGVTNECLCKYINQCRARRQKVVRPDWCSPMRWRMFGQWLKNRERFAGAGESLDCLDKKDVLFLWR